ncbi:MAG: hypothetical protein IH881_18125 [Myxococcales bacterium]|nr:hypothetical protein [Myxococcales bacterium]
MTITSRRLVGMFLLSALVLVMSACDNGKRYDQALCVLIDVSGTYADQRKEVVRIVKREVLPNLEPGDTLLILRIDGESYEKDNVEVLIKLDPRPSRANAEKLGIAQHLDRMASRTEVARHTDIPGAMMLGGEYLREIKSGSRVMLIFSDMEEDLAPGAERTLRPDEFAETHVVAMNVKRLRGDNVDPDAFRSRLASWESRVMSSGALSWKTILNPNKLGGFLSDIREAS